MTTQAILDQLDACAERLAFPMLDAPGFRLAAARLHAYRDDSRWALLIETLGCHEFGAGHEAIDNCLHVYGSSLHRPPGVLAEDYLFPTADGDEGPTFDDRQYVRRTARTLRIRGGRCRCRISHRSMIWRAVRLPTAGGGGITSCCAGWLLGTGLNCCPRKPNGGRGCQPICRKC
ncbi:hypothetical protein J8C04_05745 [Chloracidobacterium sp. A]|nr:hypothetical protein [Chloracidobacterium aggregatum]QUV86885.1 hypothetical protein J8C07_06635 [Chloracidobacterium sp. S]QUV89799.1 hypothetical protein J8C04_05745 [Chloracidobacterium sp. A]